MKRVKKFGVNLALKKSEESSKKGVVFVLSAVFERANFFHVRLLNAVFPTFDGYEV